MIGLACIEETMTMRIRRAVVLGASVGLAVASAVVLSGCPKKCQGAACDTDAGPVTGCVPDLSFDIASAVPLTNNTPVTGTICPLLDKDFFSFNTGANTLAEVTLTTTATFSAVDPS